MADGTCSGGLCHRSCGAWPTRHGWSAVAACFEILARRLEGGAFDATQMTTCTAEEMALHLVIDAAEGATRDGCIRNAVAAGR